MGLNHLQIKISLLKRCRSWQKSQVRPRSAAFNRRSCWMKYSSWNSLLLTWCHDVGHKILEEPSVESQILNPLGTGSRILLRMVRLDATLRAAPLKGWAETRAPPSGGDCGGLAVLLPSVWVPPAPVLLHWPVSSYLLHTLDVLLKLQ